MSLWRGVPDEIRTTHLAAVPNPDGELIQPTHDFGEEVATDATTTRSATDCASPTDLQLRRDPGLLDFDNVPRGK